MHCMRFIYVSKYFLVLYALFLFNEKCIFCRIVSDGPGFVCGERPPFVQTLALKLFCNQQPKPPKNERKMIPLFCSTNRRRYPVWLNLKNLQINLNFLPKVKDCCPVIIKTMTLQQPKPAR